ncbi:MAG: hypothetical protein WCP20_03980 [Desulfuromonadales bacterium]
MFGLITPEGAELSPGSFSKRFQYANDNERQYVMKLVKLAQKDKVRIHILSDSAGNSYGLVALSFSSFDKDFKRTSIVIDYIFTSLQYRGRHFAELGEMTIFEHLLGITYQSAITIKKTIPIRFIALQPASDRLAEYYMRIDFKPFGNTDWMFLSI